VRLKVGGRSGSIEKGRKKKGGRRMKARLRGEGYHLSVFAWEECAYSD
jgi:hypothetical protein